jgi:hypothetical protein
MGKMGKENTFQFFSRFFLASQALPCMENKKHQKIVLEKKETSCFWGSGLQKEARGPLYIHRFFCSFSSAPRARATCLPTSSLRGAPKKKKKKSDVPTYLLFLKIF